MEIVVPGKLASVSQTGGVLQVDPFGVLPDLPRKRHYRGYEPVTRGSHCFRIDRGGARPISRSVSRSISARPVPAWTVSAGPISPWTVSTWTRTRGKKSTRRNESWRAPLTEKRLEQEFVPRDDQHDGDAPICTGQSVRS